MDYSDHLAVLGLKAGATQQEIKTAYHTHVKYFHPDRFPGDEPQRRSAEEKMKAINAAYQYLRKNPRPAHFTSGQQRSGTTPRPAEAPRYADSRAQTPPPPRASQAPRQQPPAEDTPTGTQADRPVRFSVDPKFRFALALALVADAVQFFFIPFFVEGAESPVADVVDVAMAATLYFLLGWHWEFLPSFAAKLIPGVDLVPLWSLAVANVYRKSKRSVVPIEN